MSSRDSSGRDPQAASSVRRDLTDAGDHRREPAYFLRDVIEVERGRIFEFIDCMWELMPVFTGPTLGWQLICASYQITGRPTTIMHLWLIPDANSLPRAMRILAENVTYAKLQEVVVSEQQEILSTMPYDTKAWEDLLEGRLTREEALRIGPPSFDGHGQGRGLGRGRAAPPVPAGEEGAR